MLCQLSYRGPYGERQSRVADRFGSCRLDSVAMPSPLRCWQKSLAGSVNPSYPPLESAARPPSRSEEYR